MTIVADIPSQDEKLTAASIILDPMEIESQEAKETLVVDNAETSDCQHDLVLEDSEIKASGGDTPSAADDYDESAAPDIDLSTTTNIMDMEPSTEVAYAYAEKSNPRRSCMTTIIIAILVPLAMALIIVMIAVSHKQRGARFSAVSTTSVATSYDLVANPAVVTCGCTTCTADVLSNVIADQGTTCLDEITSLMTDVGMDESQACMLVGQEYPTTCGSCDSSSCSRRVGNCGCAESCTDAVLLQLVTDYAGAYSCKDRMQFIMDTKSMDESGACDYVSDEFPDVCGNGCRASVCQPSPEAQAFTDEVEAPVEEVEVDAPVEEVEVDAPVDKPSPEKPGLATTSSTTTDSDVCPKLMWQDEFNGDALDTSVWDYQNGDGCDRGLCGWGNNEWQSYETENVFLDDGKLVLEARNDNGVYTSGRLASRNLLDFRYGYVESSIQITRGQGIWPAFWALPTDEVFGKWPQSGEIDVMENVGREPGVVHGTIHYGDAWPNNQNTGMRVQLPNDDSYANDYHNFAVFWEEDRIRWFLNGAQYSEKTTADTNPKTWPFNNEFYLLLNVAIGGNWPGSPDDTTVFPQQMKVDYVRIYDKPFGRLMGPTVVNKTQTDVVFSLESGLSDYTYEWSVPRGATITSSSPSTSSSITVSFGRRSGFVSVVARSSKCSSGKTFSMPILVGSEYQVIPGATVEDCGCPDTCTPDVLDAMATGSDGAYSCRDRINWVMANQHVVEKSACQVVYNDFPSICTCDPSSCTK